jgi:hypothetical protein
MFSVKDHRVTLFLNRDFFSFDNLQGITEESRNDNKGVPGNAVIQDFIR